MRNPKHAAVLADIGIIYDQPLTPIEVATRRAERIAKEKQKTAQAAAVSIPPWLLKCVASLKFRCSCLSAVSVCRNISAYAQFSPWSASYRTIFCIIERMGVLNYHVENSHSSGL
jgi:hypothetical protein